MAQGNSKDLKDSENLRARPLWESLGHRSASILVIRLIKVELLGRRSKHYVRNDSGTAKRRLSSHNNSGGCLPTSLMRSVMPLTLEASARSAAPFAGGCRRSRAPHW